MFGGVKSTLLTDYAHSAILIILLFVFAFSAYAINHTLGSPGRVYDLLTAAAKARPVDGNAQGSYLTMRSREGGIFFVINIVGNFGTVFLDASYWNKGNSIPLLSTAFSLFLKAAANPWVDSQRLRPILFTHSPGMYWGDSAGSRSPSSAQRLWALLLFVWKGRKECHWQMLQPVSPSHLVQ
jgi:hypothetical protein